MTPYAAISKMRPQTYSPLLAFTSRRRGPENVQMATLVAECFAVCAAQLTLPFSSSSRGQRPFGKLPAAGGADFGKLPSTGGVACKHRLDP